MPDPGVWNALLLLRRRGARGRRDELRAERRVDLGFQTQARGGPSIFLPDVLKGQTELLACGLREARARC